jgi:hypothetical protein
MDKKFICKICNKNYKSYQSLWNHNRKYHSNLNHNEQNMSISMSILSDSEQNNKLFKCEFCNKQYKHIQSKNRHQKKCTLVYKNKCEILEKENKELKNKYKEHNTKIKELKDQLLEMMNKQCKMHHQTFNKIQNQLTNNFYSSVKNYNNFTFNIVQLGQEDLVNTLSKKEQLKVLNKKYKSLNYLVDYIHCNDKFPEFNNVIITNLQNNIAYKYDLDKQKFIAIKKNELIDDIIYYRMGDLEEFYDIHLNNLDTKTKNIITEIINKMDGNNKFINKKKNEIKLILYNNKKDTTDCVYLNT